MPIIPDRTTEEQPYIYTIIETGLILAGVLVLLFMLPHRVTGDGYFRFRAVTQLLTRGGVSSLPYSFVGPIFSIPLWLLGKWYKSPEWWCARYNFIVFAIGLFLIWRILRKHLNRSILRKFLIILIAGSMFPCHLQDYHGEVFTAILVGTGILAVVVNHSFKGWSAIVLGVVNIPASIIGLGCVVVKHALEKRRWRYFLALVIAAGLILTESWIRRGHPFITGYEGDAGSPTMLPYSGKPGFSYPFFFGIISILFSFGKGILFFAPGLLLSLKSKLPVIKQELYAGYKLWIYFLIGLILIYAKWWGWYGGWFWGPRFFLFASIPASFALAVHVHQLNKSVTANLFTLGVLCLSVWVGINGAVFGQSNLEICYANHYALEALCWYVPEFSVLWRPFVVSKPLKSYHIVTILYYTVVFIYLSAPLLQTLAKQINMKLRDFAIDYLDFGKWRY
jgi:hypothetical protein